MSQEHSVDDERPELPAEKRIMLAELTMYAFKVGDRPVAWYISSIDHGDPPPEFSAGPFATLEAAAKALQNWGGDNWPESE